MARDMPAGFVLFTEDVLSSSKIALMSDQEFRAYVNLWLHCWQLHCAIPLGPEEPSRGHSHGNGDSNGQWPKQSLNDGQPHGQNVLKHMANYPMLDGLAGRKVTPLVLSCFIDHPEKPGFITHPKLYKQLLKVQSLRERGKKGAAARWGAKIEEDEDAQL